MKNLQSHFDEIAKQRAILQTYEAWEYTFDAFQRPRIEQAERLQAMARAAKVNVKIRTPESFATLYADYHHNLDQALSRLKIAASIGTPLDISDRPVAHDIRCISDPFKLHAHLGDKQRARDNLIAIDFFDECGHMPGEGVHVTKVTIPKWEPIPDTFRIEMVASEILTPDYMQIVIASFEDPDDATLYKLTVA